MTLDATQTWPRLVSRLVDLYYQHKGVLYSLRRSLPCSPSSWSAASRSRSRRTAAHSISHVLAVDDETRGEDSLCRAAHTDQPGSRSRRQVTRLTNPCGRLTNSVRYCPARPCPVRTDPQPQPESGTSRAVPFEPRARAGAHATRRGAVPCIYADAGRIRIHQHQRTNARWIIPRPLACFCSNEF